MGDVFVTSADLSHDATWVAYATLTADDGADHDRLWISPVDTDGSQPVHVDLPGAASALSWSPYTHVLAVGVAVGGVRQIVLVEIDGSWRQLTHTVRGMAGTFCWSPDGAELAAAVLHDEPPSVERVAATMDGIGSVADQVSDIHLIDGSTGASTPLTGGPTLDRAPVFDGSGEQVLFCRSHAPDSPVFAETPLLVDRSGNLQQMGWTANAYSTMAPLADDRMVLCSTRQSDRPREVPSSLYVRAADDTVVDRTEGLDLHLLLSTLSDQPSPIEDPRRFIGVHTDGAIVGVCRSGAAEVVRIALDGPIEATTILSGERGCHPLSLKGDHLLFAESTMHGPPTLRLLNLATDAETTVVDPNPARAANVFEVHTLDVVSQGDAIQTWFLAPTGATSTPLPTVLVIHGGPYEAFGHCYYGDAHVLVEAGYGVLMANPRGSIGYGADFATSIFGRPSMEDFDDLIAAVDRAVELGLADGDRLAVCGLSYGGYMSAHLAARTGRFKAAVIENPLIDMPSFPATSDIGADLLNEMLQGAPDEIPGLYRDCSPLYYAEHCRTPSLLILGEDDHRCPPSQGLLFRDASRRTGCVTDLVWLPGAAHADSAFGPSEVRSLQDRALLDWVQRYNPV